MKVVVQNGARHGLSRRQVEAMGAVLPPTWQRSIASLTLCQGRESEFCVKHYPKERKVGAFWPAEQHPQPSIERVVEELLVSLEVIAKRGSLPAHLSKALRGAAAASTAELRARCMEILAENGA